MNTLSPERKELLKKNKDKIKAFVVHEAGNKATGIEENNSCLYDYGDGHICGASAGLTDGERAHLATHYNDRGIDIIQTMGDVKFLSLNDSLALTRLQRAHDKYMMCAIGVHGFEHDNPERMFEQFENIFNYLISEE